MCKHGDGCDEIAAYLNCRYVLAPEAIWRLSGYKMHEQSHSIYRLAVHLPEQQRVYYREGEEASTRNTQQFSNFQQNMRTNQEQEFSKCNSHS